MTEPEPRSNLIDNAVKFLQDPQVRASSLSKQLNFLESKGLTLREVEEAMKRAGVTTHNDKVAVIVPSSEEGHPPPLPQSPPPNRLQLERSFSWGRFLLTLALIGSASVALSQSVLLNYLGRIYQRVKQYISPQVQNGENLNSELLKVKAMQEELQKSLERVKEQLNVEVESVKTCQNYLYRELCDDLEDLREQFKISLRPIEIGNDDDGKLEQQPEPPLFNKKTIITAEEGGEEQSVNQSVGQSAGQPV